jgi:predicted DNA-binding transcriptional regulator AlpA
MLNKRVLSTAEVGRLTGVTPSAVRYWVATDETFPKPKRLGRHYKFKLGPVLSWMAENGIQPKVEPATLGYIPLEPRPGDRLLSGEQVAQLLGIRRAWFYRLLAEGRLPAADEIGPSSEPSFWLESSVLAWVSQERA